jgi:FMN phosphatase YigB (HAD superfamily)
MIRLKDLVKEVQDANLLEEQQIITVYFDMDGVLCDFDKQFVHFTNEEPISFERKRGTVKFWEIITNHGVKFWNQMDPMPDFNILKKYITELSKNPNIKIQILTSTSADQFRQNFKKEAEMRISEIETGKKDWIDKHLSGYVINYADSGTDKARFATKSSVLIDDLYKNVESFIASGGEGIVFRDANQTIKELNATLSIIKETCGYSRTNL